MKTRGMKKVFSLLITFSLIFQQTGLAQIAGQLDMSKFMGQVNVFSGPQNFRPLHLRYFSYDILTDNFQILLDKGNLKKLEGKQLKEQSQELLKYFLVGVTLPDAKFWVNLRPDSEDQIIDWELARTDLGKVLLEADLQLKKDLAQFTSPETAEGRWYWNKLYEKAGQIFGGQNITIPTLTRPWIVPGEVIIRENANSAYVYKATLKVMLEQDHLRDSPLRGQSLYSFKDPRLKELNDYSSQLIREKIIPKLTREVNASAKYAPLRQVFFSLILSRWFKSKFSGKAGLYPSLINTRNLNGLTSQQAWSKTPYFKEYQKSFNNGEYNIKEQASTVFGPTIRTYFSGGVALEKMTPDTFNGVGNKVPGASGPNVVGLEGNAPKMWAEGFKNAAEAKAAHDDVLKAKIADAFDRRRAINLFTDAASITIQERDTKAFATSALLDDAFILALARKIVSTIPGEKGIELHAQVKRLLDLHDRYLYDRSNREANADRFKFIRQLKKLLIDETRWIAIASTDPYLLSVGDIHSPEHKAFVAHAGTFPYEGSDKVSGGPRSIYLTMARIDGYRELDEAGRAAFQQLIMHEFTDFIAGKHVEESLPALEAANAKIKSAYQEKAAGAKASRTTDLKEYKKIGQQIYLDGVTWEQIESGEFERLVKEQGINGVTTNPPLIKKYLASKKVQDKAKQLSKQFAAEGLSLEEVQKRVYRELIADLAEQVIQVFIRNGVKDATFSIEIDPTKADDIGASVKEAMEWLNIKNGQYRDYILVKVLANETGCEVIRQVTALGGNVNATVLFSPEQYDKVIEAYIDGLEDADETGIDISKIRSVASFFVSRWDVKLAPDLSAEQQGKAGNAITTVAYHEVFKKWFNSARFQALQAEGARVQQFLAASTGSKGKAIAQALKKKPEYKGKDKEVDELVARAYPFDIYVSPLQGEGIINTLPYETIADLMSKGFIPEATITQEANYKAARQLLDDIRDKNKKDIEAVGAVLLKEGLQSFIDDYLDIQRTLAGIVGYQGFKGGVNAHAEANRVDPYSPLPGTPDLRQKTAELINREILKAQGMEISSADVTVSLGTTGLLEHLTRIFCNIERGALKKLKQKDAVALSPHAKALYSPKTVFARITDLKAKSPKMMVIDSWDIEAVNLNKLLDQAIKDKTVVIFLDNDPTHRNMAQVYQLLNQNEQYRPNTVIVTDLSRRFGLPEYNVGSFVTFNKAIVGAYAAAVGGSIAAVSTEVQAGFAKLVAARLPEAVAPSQAGNKIAAIEDKDVLNRTFRDMAPDPTLSISPLGMLGQYKLSEIFQGTEFNSFRNTIVEALGAAGQHSLYGYIKDKDTIPISDYEGAFNKANNLGIIKRLLAAESEYVEALFAQYGSDRETFLSKLMDEPNPAIVEILKKVFNGGQGQLSVDEIVRMWIVFNIKKMHVGAPGFPRDEFGTKALQLPEERLTPEQIAQLDEQLLDAGVYFGKVFGLSLGRENVSAGYYGSKTVTQDIAIALELLYGKEVTIARPQPDYVGNTSSLLGAGVPREAMNMYPTKTSNSWVPTAAEVKRAIDQLNPNSIKLIRLTTPDNPSGTAVPQERIEEILELAVRNDAFLELDVAYARLLFKGKKPANLEEVCANIFQRLDDGIKARKGIKSAADITKYFILIQTQSKEILQPGPREGTAVSGNTELIKKMREIKIFEADPVAKKAQVEIYGPNGVFYSEEYIQKHIQHLERNANYICQTLDRLGIHYVKPEGAFYILFRIGKGPYIRFSFAGSFTDIVEVMARIERAYPKWKENKVDLSSVDLFKQVGITSVAGEIFGAPKTKAEEDTIEQATTADVNVQAEPITWQDYAELARLVRYDIVRSLYLAGSGHANTALSDVNMLLALYAAGGMHYDARDSQWNYRDRFVTKGHGYMSIYSVLAAMGFFPPDDLNAVRDIQSHLSGHVTVKTPGIDANTGILGQSLSIALGMAINAKLEGTKYTTFCNIGDGETQEGQIYAAAEAAASLTQRGKMGKLVAMIDWNGAERDGWVKNFGTVSIDEKWAALGWQVIKVDGNDVFAMKAAIDQAKTVQDKPTVIICETQKGKGVSYLSEGDNSWARHGTPPKNAAEYFQALKELGIEVGEHQKMQVVKQEVEIDDAVQTLAGFNMARIHRVVAEIQKGNQEYRQQLETGLAPNAHLQPTQFSWDGKPAQRYQPGAQKPTRQAAGEYFVNLLKTHPELRDRMVFFTMDLKDSECLGQVTKDVPNSDYMMGIREDVTASAASGLSLASQGRIVPVVGTFAAFLLNMGPQLRIAQQTPGSRIIVYMAHGEALDVGGDGPTHQPEYLANLAQTLNLNTFMPADANTMWDALNDAVNSAINDPASGVSLIAAVRGTDISSSVYNLGAKSATADSFLAWQSQGIDEANKPDGIIVATGPAMLNLSIQAAKKLDAEGKKIRVIYVQHLNVIGKEGSEFYNLVEPGVPIVTAQDGLKSFLGGLVSDALTSLPVDWGEIPRVASVGITGIPKTGGIAKGISYRGERGQALAAYTLYGMDPDSIAGTLRKMIDARRGPAAPVKDDRTPPSVPPTASGFRSDATPADEMRAHAGDDFRNTVQGGKHDGVDAPGGIDFRAIPMITRPMGTLSGLSVSLPKLSNVENINLDEELRQIQKMLAAGITPSGERMKEYVAACYQKGELKTYVDGIVGCLVDICKLEEQKVAQTPKEVKELLLIMDSVG